MRKHKRLKTMGEIKKAINWNTFKDNIKLTKKDKRDIYSMISNLMGLYAMGDIDPYGTMKTDDGNKILIELQNDIITIYQINGKKLSEILAINITTGAKK